MLAKVSPRDDSPQKEFIDAERSLKKQSACGCVPPNDPPGHADGCGVAFVRDSNIVIVRRGKEDAWNETFLETVRRIRSQLSVGHNRKASSGLTAGKVGPDCAHPFQGDFKGTRLAFCQNGTIRAVMKDANARSVTDSQIFLEAILGGVERLDADCLTARVSELAAQYGAMAGGYTSLTSFLMTPSQLFAWLLYWPGDRSRAPSAWYPGYYTLWFRQTNDGVLVASEPIDAPGYPTRDQVEGWEALKNGTFVSVVVNGERIDVQRRHLEISQL